MEKRRDQQTRIESKTRAVVRINICLTSGDYSRAMDLLRGTAAEFPNDAELSELEKLAQAGVNRKAEADRLITESQELFAQQKSAKAIQLLREAYALDKNNALSRAILANSLVEHAHTVVESDWWEAETLANEALTLNPAHPTAKTVHSLILDKKTTSSLDEWVSQTLKLQSSGKLTAALSQIAEAFAVYPREPRLLQIQDVLQRDHAAQRRQARRRDLEDLRRTGTEIDAVTDEASKKALAERIRAATSKYSTDGEFLTVSNGLLHRLELREVELREAPQKSSSAPSVPSVPEAALAAPIQIPPSPDPAANTPTVVVQPSVPPASNAATSVAASSTVPPIDVLPSKVPAIKVPASTLPPGIVSPSNVPSSKIPPRIKTAAKVASLPSAPQVPSPPAAEPIVTAVKFTAPSSRPSEPAKPNSTPLILVSAAAGIILVAAIFFFAGKHYATTAEKTSTTAPAVSVPAASAPPVVAATVPAPTTPDASQPASRPSADTAAGNVTPSDQPPAIESGHNLGTLVVVTGQDDARVFLDGKLQRQLTQRGQLRLPNLEFKDYVVQVSKSGFQDPPQQKIRIRGGEQARLVFTLQPKAQPQPRLASLAIQGGTAGTTVLVDQTPVGAVQPDGTLSVSNVNPGDHTVELRRERFKPRQFAKHFVAGGTIALAAADAALEPAPGLLKITFAPADAKVAIAKTGDLPTIVSSGVPLNLAAGTYTLTAQTAERFTRSSTVEVVAGQSKTLDLSLAPNGMSKWDDPGAWKHEGDSFLRKGGDFVLYGVVPASGTFALSAMPAKGHLLQWVLNYTDARNYVLFQMDDNNFYRTVVRNGQKTDAIKVPDKGDNKGLRTLHIRVSATEIVHQIKHGNSWTVVDRWTQPGVNLSLGKFGFYMPGNDEVALSNFSHYADFNIR